MRFVGWCELGFSVRRAQFRLVKIVLHRLTLLTSDLLHLSLIFAFTVFHVKMRDSFSRLSILWGLTAFLLYSLFACAYTSMCNGVVYS